MRIVVLGGGITGLAAGHFLVEAGHDVLVLEPTGRPGGAMRSERREGFLCETGPQAVFDGAADTRALVAAAGLDARLIRAAPASRRRFIFRGGRLVPVPTGPFALTRSPLLSATGKLRLLREPFVARRPDGVEDESILAFARRRLGDEAASTLVAPAVIGIYAGDAAGLSARSCLPRLWALETQHGSLVRGMFRARRNPGARLGKLFSFPDGLEELPRGLAARLGPRLRTARPAGLAPLGQGYRVSLEGGQAEDAEAVVVTSPAAAAAALLAPLLPRTAEILRGIVHAPVAVAALGFRRSDIGMATDNYGFLVARGEPVSALLGCQYESSIFAGRAPEGAVLVRAILGGSFTPGLVERDEAAIAAQAVSDLRACAGLTREPDMIAVWRWPAAVPQYPPGHATRVAEVDAELAGRPGLHLLGHALRGVGVADCIGAAAALARRLGASGGGPAGAAEAAAN